MLTSELFPRQMHDTKTTNLLHKLSLLGEKTAEVINGESIEIKARERAIGRMKTGVASFLTGWENPAQKEQCESSVLRAKQTFEEKQGAYEGARDKKKPGSELDEAKEKYQVALTGFLFAKNRELFVADRGSTTAFDKKKEERQIEGVLRAVNDVAGQHLHIGTGEGKSTVILPIAALVEAATNGDGAVVLGSANGILVDELRQNTMRLANTASVLGDIKFNNITTEGKGKKEVTDEGLASQITKDILLTGSASEATKKNLKSNFWREFVQPRGHDDFFHEDPSGKAADITLYFAEEKDLVFKWMDDPKAFISACPKIFMDEAHVAYDKGTPYAQTMKSIAIGEDDIKGGISNWLVHYVVAHEVGNTDVMPASGGYHLTENGRAKLDTIDLHAINPNNKASYSQSFYQGVGIILKTMGVEMDDKQSQEFAQRLLTETLSTLPQKNGNEAGEGEPGVSDYLQSIGGEVAKFVRLKDKMFTERKGKVVIRDGYIDELLSAHKYTPNAQSAALAVCGIFEPIKREVAYKTAHYPSFVKAIGERYIALSGTLMHPNPEEGRMEKGTFASFLKRVTGKETYALSTPEMKPLPQPHLFEKPDEMYTVLINDLRMERGFDVNGPRPTLLIDFNGLESATKTFEQMKKVYGDDGVRLLLSKPTGGDIEAEKEYMHQLDEYRSDLAQGKIKMLVSSGSAALGVNFVKPDGSFPDLRTVMVGMPDSQERMIQTIGRRRMQEGTTHNHLWYLSIADLETQESLLTRQNKSHYIGLEKSQQQMHAELLRVRNDPEKVYGLIKSLMQKLKTARTSDEDRIIRSDSLINELVIPYATARLEGRIAHELLHYDEKTIERINDLKRDLKAKDDRMKRLVLNKYMDAVGLPSTIHEDAQSMNFLFAQEQKKQFGVQNAVEQFEEQMRLLKRGIFSKTPSSFNIDTYIDDWFEDSKKAADEYVRLTGYPDAVGMLEHLQEGNWAWSPVEPLKIDDGIYSKSALVQTTQLSNGLPLEMREVPLPDGKEKIICFTHDNAHYLLCNPLTGDAVGVPPKIVEARMDFIPASLGNSYWGTPLGEPFALLSMKYGGTTTLAKE